MRRAARFFLFAFFLAATAARAADMKLEARLVWGTNDEKGGPNCKPVDAGLSARLHRTFKWSNYFEITKQVAAIPEKQTRDLRMSDRCTLRIRNLGGSRVEINCIGEGKQVHKREDTLMPHTWLVLGGNDKDNTAWFIALRTETAQAGDASKVISKN
jgi:hypothetical protein